MEEINAIKNCIIARYPIIYITSWEEGRVEKLLETITATYIPNRDFFIWSVSSGMRRKEERIDNTNDPLKAIEFAILYEKPAAFVFKDIHPFINQRPEVSRALRDAYQTIKNTQKVIFLLSPFAFLPQELKKEIEIIDFPLPSYGELENLFTQVLSSFASKRIPINLNEKDKKSIVIALQGLTFDEAYRALIKSFQGKSTISSEVVEELHLEKRQIILKEFVLEYVHEKLSIDEIGGLENLKDWLKKRQKAFTPEAKKYGLDQPKGLLIMGVSGCGKSISVKAIASLWSLPLFRLDMNLVYSGIAGAPEEAFARALKTMDSLAPAVLWIDEIESGINDKVSEGATGRILGYFLTWMQEHRSPVFIAATANRIDLLPAEMLRRGRFDQIFFVDLPIEKEREEIFRIHLSKRNVNPEQFNISQLAKITKGWSGAEIEQAIISSMYESFNEGRPMSEDDLFKIFSRSVPLSTTMYEQIKRIREWAHKRAVRASEASLTPEI
ncbi:MAG: AAA family ATPase [Candidatus Aminicenantia bacterium]